MRGAIQIIRLFGIPVQVHWSFLLLFVWVGYVGLSTGMGASSMGWLALFMLALFACVVLHEFGHALMARRFGIRTHDIILLPIGGVARLDCIPEKPVQELLVALAGPAVNVALAVLLWGWLSWHRGWWVSEALTSLAHPSGALFLYSQNFLPALAFTNLFVAAFNLLPAFPLDGGRVVRALLSVWWSRLTATRVAAYLGQGIAVLLLILAFLHLDLILGLIAVFVFTTASREYQFVLERHVLQSVPVHRLMRCRYTLLSPSASVAQALELLTRLGEPGFLISEGTDTPHQLVHETALLAHLADEQPPLTPIARLAKPVPSAVAPSTPLSEALSLMERHDVHFLPVVAGSSLCGVIDREQIKKLGKLYARHPLKAPTSP